MGFQVTLPYTIAVYMVSAAFFLFLSFCFLVSAASRYQARRSGRGRTPRTLRAGLLGGSAPRSFSLHPGRAQVRDFGFTDEAEVSRKTGLMVR